jgi:1-deoxy-D-xylulose-5-phosphate synthase
MDSILNKIENTSDLKKLNMNEMNLLSKEIRDFLIKSVSQTGGHLASNLGVVELTLAIHYVFDSPKDKIIWDVGHQSYVHKILTGRKNQFDTLRQLNGMSGFPKRSENEHDAFATGHSSTSISAAVGFINARDLLGENYNVISVIGDGALTGGMAFEALNDVGRRKTNLIIILNDNEMSISKNVGSISSSLSKLRTGTTYYSAKKEIEKMILKIPYAGKKIVKLIRKTKDAFKIFFVNGGMLFEEFGFRYIGPVDGHDLEAMVQILERVKDVKAPILLHVHTKKGKGYKPAEENPDVFHGVGKFNANTGQIVGQKSLSFSDVFGQKLTALAKENEKIVAITAAMKNGTGLDLFSEKYPKRFFDVGIAEQHGLTMAAGMAANGMIPVVAIYSTFLQRAYDQLVHDVAMQNLHVVLCVDRAGLVGSDGETHQGVFDMGLLCQIPNVTILAPSSFNDLERMLEWAIQKGNGPIVIRYPRGGESAYHIPESNIIIGSELLRKGKDITLISYGRLIFEVYRAAEILKERGIDAGVINLKSIKPLDGKIISQESDVSNKVLFIDETAKYASVGRYIYDFVSNHTVIKIHGLPDHFIEQGSVDELTRKYKLDAENIASRVTEWIDTDS